MFTNIKKEATGSFEEVVERTKKSLKEIGFGILTEIDVKKTFKEKINVDFPKFTILGACNPVFAHKALTLTNDVSLMMPCNVVVKEISPNKCEVTTINPVEAMAAFEHDQLTTLAAEIEPKLKAAIASI